jgi:hypothetical protein
MNFVSCAVFLVNSLYTVKESVLFLVESVCEAYRTKSWVFTTRNAYPVMLSSTWNVDTSIQLVYLPDRKAFLENAAYDKQTVDSVTAEVKTPKGTVYDMSSFLYDIKWYNVPPSLYELVLLYFLHEKICVSTDTLNTYTLTLLTSDAEELIVPLHSPPAQSPFRGFHGLKVD